LGELILIGHVSEPLYLDSPATFAFIFKNYSETAPPPPLTPTPPQESPVEPLLTYADLFYVNDFDRSDLENDSKEPPIHLQNEDEESSSAPKSQSEYLHPFPQSSASISHSIPIMYQLEIPSGPTTLSISPQTLQISNESNGTVNVSDSNEPWNETQDKISSNLPVDRSLTMYHPPLTLQVPKSSRDTIIPLSSITVTLQQPLPATPSEKYPLQNSFPIEDDGYLLISESEDSNWAVGMRVPFPFSHPRYDPNKIPPSTTSLSSQRLPSFIPPLDPLQEELMKFPYDYKFSSAYMDYEKCLLSQWSVDGQSDISCNLTEFIEIEKQKLANNNKFLQELNSADGIPLVSPNNSPSASVGILVLVGVFGGVMVSILLIVAFFLYMYYAKGSNPSSILQPPQSEEITTHLTTSKPKHPNLEIFHEQELGRGSNGTVVLRGLFEGRRHVAVKKMVARFHNFERERSILSAADGHSNIVRYIQSIQDGDFYLLVLELCNMSLW
jgi:hypothetical protein